MNIEKTISEHAVSDILTPMLACQDRIVTEDVAQLFDQATGLDTPPASGTVTTTIEESRSVITAIIRKAWTATLTMLGGASVIGYITAAYTYLRNRLQGNETYGIPDRRSEISASSPLAANLALLNDRKIGGADVPDGMSIIHLLGDTTVPITEMTDDNEGWTLNKSVTLPASVTKLTAKCVKATATISGAALEDVVLPELIETGSENGSVLINSASVKTISCDKVKRICGSIYNNANGELEELHIPEVTSARPQDWGMTFQYSNTSAPIVYACNSLKKVVSGLKVVADIGKPYSNNIFRNCPNLEWIEFGKPTYFNCVFGGQGSEWTKLVHLEFADGVDISLNLANWSPTLDSSNLQQFLENFRDYIANRLTDNGSGKTLTLSQSVFSEIWDSQGQPQVKGDGLDELRADIHRIIRTDKQWAVNKA